MAERDERDGFLFRNSMPEGEAIFLTSKNYSMVRITQILNELNQRTENIQMASYVGKVAGYIPEPIVQTLSKIGPAVVEYLQDTQALKEVLILEKVDAKIIDIEMNNLKAKIETIVSNVNLIIQGSVFKDEAAVSALTAASEVASLLTNPDHIYMKHPLASTPYFVIFCGVQRILSEYITSMSDQPLSVLCQLQENALRLALANYEKRCIDIRLDGIFMEREPVSVRDVLMLNLMAPILVMSAFSYSIKDVYAGIKTYYGFKSDMEPKFQPYRSNVKKAYNEYFKNI